MIAGETVMTQALTAPQRKELKALLLARRANLAEQIAGNRANLAPAENTAGSVSQDENGRLSNQTREVDTALTAMDEQELARIDRALEAMDDGEYGKCEECGCNIPFERLKIEAMTQHCVKCKSRWEKSHP
jgi:DnaK suppressor protein